MNPPNTSRIQFDLATMLWMMGAVGILVFLWRWTGYFPFLTLLPAVILLLAWRVAKRQHAPDLVWGLLAIGWCLVCCHIANALKEIFCVSCGPFSFAEIREMILLLAYCSNIFLPTYLSIPVIATNWQASHGRRSYSRKWLILCPLIGVLDVTALTVCMMFIFLRMTWPG